MWIVLWLSIFWAKLIKSVWWEITKLNQIRAFCIILSAAITVIIASWFWLPVSSTHIALGWIFWVWLFREHLKRLKWKNKEYIRKDVIKTIALAWFVTLPISWAISAITYIIITKLS
jgi:PiT family inorganic phosphate transporter